MCRSPAAAAADRFGGDDADASSNRNESGRRVGDVIDCRNGSIRLSTVCDTVFGLGNTSKTLKDQVFDGPIFAG